MAVISDTFNGLIKFFRSAAKHLSWETDNRDRFPYRRKKRRLDVRRERTLSRS
jgi:hypothetical protein